MSSSLLNAALRRSCNVSACSRICLSTLNPAHSSVVVQRCMSTKTGRVKFYRREKGFGFIKPDDNPNVDIFVHRNSISCSPPLPADFTSFRWPYLKQNERVRFDTVTDSESGQERAVQVMWLDGTPIPPERTNYLGGVHERAKRIFGEEVYELMEDSSDKSDEELAKAVRTLRESALANIQNAENFVRRLGMDPATMPTVKAGAGRGKYFFSKEEADAQTKANKTKTKSDTEQTSVVSGEDAPVEDAESSVKAPAPEVAPLEDAESSVKAPAPEVAPFK